MIDTKAPDSDGWWLQRGWDKLADPRRVRRLEKLDAYRRGEPPLVEGLESRTKAVQDLWRSARTNLADLISEATRERMQMVGVRTGVDDGDAGDLEAWSLWRRCGGPVELAEILALMLSLGDGYGIVGFDDDTRLPVLTAEDPRQVTTFHDPRRQRVVRAGVKFFHDPEAGRDYGYLYLPGRVRVAVLDRSADVYGRMGFDARQWSWSDEVDDEPLGGDLPPGMKDAVPIVRFRNRRGVGEYEHHTDLLDRINRKILREMVIMTYQAFRQRAVKGDLPAKDHEGNEIDWESALEAGPDALWLLPPNIDIWESGQVDLSGVLNATKADLLLLAAVTRTPLSMFTPDAAAQSAEGASLQREGLTFKAEDRIARADDAVSQVLSLMFRFRGDAARGNLDNLQPMWAPVDRYSLAEQGSAWSQLSGMAYQTKLRTIMRMAPDEVSRAMTERADEQLQAAITAARTAAAAPPAA